MTSELSVSFVAQNAATALETFGRIDSSFLSPNIQELISSMKRIQEMNVETPDQATEALQDHFNAMSSIAGNQSDLVKLQTAVNGSLFVNCESVLKILLSKGARARISR
jgi:hypothetical protein